MVEDGGAEFLDGGSVVVHPHPSAEAVEPPGDVNMLLEMGSAVGRRRKVPEEAIAFSLASAVRATAGPLQRHQLLGIGCKLTLQALMS
jgi:hypothetical protein